MGSRSGMLTAALWLGAWLRGGAAADDVLDALTRAAPQSTPQGLLADVRACGADRAWLLLPRPGHVVGWPIGAGAPPSPAVLLSAGPGGTAHGPAGGDPNGRTPATRGHILLPGTGRWVLGEVPDPGVLRLEGQALPGRAARRALDAALADATATFERLDLARAPSTPSTDSWAAAVTPAPPAVPQDALAVLHRCALVLDALERALGDDGAAVTSQEVTARGRALRQFHAQLEDVVCGVVGGLNPVPVP